MRSMLRILKEADGHGEDGRATSTVTGGISLRGAAKFMNNAGQETDNDSVLEQYSKEE